MVVRCDKKVGKQEAIKEARSKKQAAKSIKM